MFVLTSETIKAKKKIVVLPSSGISEYLGWLVGFFLNDSFLKSTQKYNIRVHFPLFFLEKGEKTPNLTKKLGAFPTLMLRFFFFLFFSSIFGDGWLLRATQHPLFSLST